MTKVSDNTKGQIEKFLDEENEARSISPEMEETREMGYLVIQSKAKINSYKTVLRGLSDVEDEDATPIKSMLEKAEAQLAERSLALKERVEEQLQDPEHKKDFVNVGKLTKFASSLRAVDLATISSTQNEVQRRVAENINEEIIKIDTEAFIEMFKDETNDNIQRFVEMYKPRAVPKALGDWGIEHLADEQMLLRWMEQLEEMKGRTAFEDALKATINRYLSQSITISDETIEDKEKKEFFKTQYEFLMGEFKKAYQVF